MSATPLQLARAYAVLANEGMKLPLTLLSRINRQWRTSDETGLTNKCSRCWPSFPKAVRARRPSCPLSRCRKTGTVACWAEGYQAGRHLSSFVGIAPAAHPALVVAVLIRDPQGKHYYGGPVSGPVFAHIMEGALRVMNVEPDLKKAMILRVRGDE